MKVNDIFSRSSFLLMFLTIFYHRLPAQDTFSIVAVDSVTGEIGSAGASCVGSSTTYPHGAQIISDVIPGIGAIHTQAAWNPVNQQNAHNWMTMGLSPQQIIDSLVAHDVTNNPATRQYGIVDYNGGHPRAAGFTGVNCLNYKNDTSNIFYSVQGNILLDQQIIDSIQSRFLNTAGPLSDRLMAALQGANVVGADSRCAVHGTSSQSSFIRVAKMTDPPDSLYCDLWMSYPQNATGIYPVDPIDSLQTLYDLWKMTVSARDKTVLPEHSVRVYEESPGTVIFDFTRCKDYLLSKLEIYDTWGRRVMVREVTSRIMKVNLPGNTMFGIFLYRVAGKNHQDLAKGKFVYSGSR